MRKRSLIKTDSVKLTAAVEAVLFASGEPIEAQRISEALLTDEETVKNCLDAIIERYSSDEHGIELLRLGDKYQFASKEKFAPEIRAALTVKKNTPLSSAAFEVLAVIAYNQPVTKAFVEKVRGVDCTGVISTLCQKNLIEEKGRLDLPGRPLLYCTTETFLRCFNLSSLEDLPEVPERLEEGENPEETDSDGQIQISDIRY